ncbi:MAG TPA: N-acetylmuramoyl-L-alanine amidase [Gemmatimonadaceae bacterium]|nr:N-acetylmuramoyl-L-alanine amidase [Gemmatimonadaceae bacterium]
MIVIGDRTVRALYAAVFIAATGCAGRPPSTPSPQAPPAFPETAPVTAVTPPPAQTEAQSAHPPLPPIPFVIGEPLNPTVVYPVRDQLIASRDSNFIIGSIGSGDATLTINDVPVEVKANGAYVGWLAIPDGTEPIYRLVARRGDDSAVFELPVRTWRTPVPPVPPPTRPTTPPPQPRLGPISLGVASADTDKTVVIRPVMNGTYKWFAVPGTIVERTATENGWTRVRLDSALEAYVQTSDVNELDSVSALPRRVVGNLVVVPDSAWTDVLFPLSSPPPFLVEEDHDKLIVTLYSTRGTTDIISYRPGDALVRAVTWEPIATDRVRYVVHLRRAPFGYVMFHDGQRLVLRVRKAPTINKERPLDGLTIAVDAGHPPAGSTGPTGLYEGDATLPISFALQQELEQRGARVFMTRTQSFPVDLTARPIEARRANAHALISIHLNALPDGVNPITTNGTGTYFFHPHSEPLARAVQAGMVRSMGLRDLGVYFDNLALVRPTWMPAILCEGAFVIVPEQEAAMRDPAGQRAYARGVAAGIEAYFKALGSSQ